MNDNDNDNDNDNYCTDEIDFEMNISGLELKLRAIALPEEAVAINDTKTLKEIIDYLYYHIFWDLKQEIINSLPVERIVIENFVFSEKIDCLPQYITDYEYTVIKSPLKKVGGQMKLQNIQLMFNQEKGIYHPLTLKTWNLNMYLKMGIIFQNLHMTKPYLFTKNIHKINLIIKGRMNGKCETVNDPNKPDYKIINDEFYIFEETSKMQLIYHKLNKVKLLHVHWNTSEQCSFGRNLSLQPTNIRKLFGNKNATWYQCFIKSWKTLKKYKVQQQIIQNAILLPTNNTTNNIDEKKNDDDDCKFITDALSYNSELKSFSVAYEYRRIPGEKLTYDIEDGDACLKIELKRKIHLVWDQCKKELNEILKMLKLHKVFDPIPMIQETNYVVEIKLTKYTIK